MSGLGTDYTTTPHLGLYKPIANMAVGLWGDLWNSNADALDSAINFATGGGPFLPLQGGIVTAPAGSTVNALTINTSDNGPTCNNGLEVVQGYAGGNLAMGHGLTPHTASVRFGAETFHDHFARVFVTANRATGQYNNLESVLTIPAGLQSSSLNTAFGASVVDYDGRGGALAGIFYASAMSNNATLWALNTVCTDSDVANNNPGPFSGVREQIECDWFVRNNTTTVRGILQILSSTVPQLNAASWYAFSTGLFPGSYPWSVGFISGNGTAATAFIAGSKTTGSPAITGDPSQDLQFLYTDNTTAATHHAALIYADPRLAGATGTDLRITADYAGRVNPTLDNLASLKAMNAAGTATLPLMVLTGQDQLSIGDGVNTVLIRGSAPVGSIAQFNSVANGVNDIVFTHAVAGSAPTISSFHGAGGTDTNIGLNISAFGTGVITLANATRINGNVGFNTAPIAKPSVAGAWAGNTAGKALSTALAALGLITDTTTA